MTLNRQGKIRVSKKNSRASLVSKAGASVQQSSPASRASRVRTPVEQAARERVTTQAQEDGTLRANDMDVLRIARAVVEHRKGLMDRLAK